MNCLWHTLPSLWREPVLPARTSCPSWWPTPSSAALTSPMVVERLVKCVFVHSCFSLGSQEKTILKLATVTNTSSWFSRVPFKLCPLEVVNVLSGHYKGVDYDPLWKPGSGVLPLPPDLSGRNKTWNTQQLLKWFSHGVPIPEQNSDFEYFVVWLIYLKQLEEHSCIPVMYVGLWQNAIISTFVGWRMDLHYTCGSIFAVVCGWGGM